MSKKKKGTDKSHRGAASEFFVAGELCRRNLVAVVTLGNCPNTDILCSNKAGTKFVHIQVKTFVPGQKTCTVGKKAETQYGERFFWVLGGIPLHTSKHPFEYYIIPAGEMSCKVAEGHRVWLENPGKRGPHRDNSIRTVRLPPHCVGGRWDISCYLNKWELIEEALL